MGHDDHRRFEKITSVVSANCRQSSINIGGKVIYRDEIVDEIKANKEIIVTVMTAMKEKLEKVNTINSDTYQQILKEIRKETGYKGRNLFHSIRVAKPGKITVPDLDKLAIVMGRDLMLERTNEFLEFAETL